MNLNEKNSHHRNKMVKSILYGILFIIIFLFLLIAFSSRWALRTWAGLTMDEIIYHLKAPLKGTGDGLVGKYVMECIVPTIIILFTISLGMIFICIWKKMLISLALAGSVLFFIISVCQFWTKLDISAYIEAQRSDTSFIKENYVNPKDVSIEFPEKKRNLIFIYLESMETTYADITSGGSFEFNCIPELTKLAQEYEDFSGDETILNGAYVMPSTSWTMGALFGHTSGLPLQISIEKNSMDTQTSFFPYVVSMGDILKSEGYIQAFMIGSDATFGGRRLYFTEHGSYEMLDYHYAMENGFILPNYKVFWGYEDKKLFYFAKEKLLELAKQELPFNLTLLTVDTHPEDGYICEDCDFEFGENQYANVMACSSRQISEFLTWIQEQDFYENTTIVLVGDHLTMDSDFCSEVDDAYDRKIYINYINSVCEPKKIDWKRTYTTFDTFPTTLAAMGVKIQGNRLGLGTNLFSSKSTLAEEHGLDYMIAEVSKKSQFIEELANLDETSNSYLKRVGKFPDASIDIMYDKEISMVEISVSNIMNLENLDRVEVEITSADTEERQVIALENMGAETYFSKLDWSLYKDKYVNIVIYLVDSTERRYLIEELPKDLSLYTNNFSEYLTALKEKENCTIFISVKDEAANSLSFRWRLKLKELGLKENLSNQYRGSYYAIISNGQLLSEQIGQEALQEEGSINNGKDFYDIYSAGYYAGVKCSIKINGEDYAMNNRGINIVVYDNINGCVLDSVCFDTHDAKTVYRKKSIREMEQEDIAIPMQLNNELQINEFNQYIDAIKKKEEYTIFISAQDEASSNFTGVMQRSLKTLGLEADLSGKYRYSYYAIIDQGDIQEELALEKLETYGTLKNGETIYEVTSAGFDCGCRASIKLNGQEFAINSIGLNIVVYDNKKNCVVDTVCFNTHGGNSLIRMDGENPYTIQEQLDQSEKVYIQEPTLQLDDMNDYLDVLAKENSYLIFMAIKDEGTAALTEELMEKLKTLGIQTELRGNYRQSYYAVIDSGTVVERIAQEEIKYFKLLEDGITMYEVISAGYECGNKASVKINGKEYAINARGLNIVVYDKEKDCVVDSVCFDTCDGLTAIR